MKLSDVFGENEVATKTKITLSELNPFEVVRVRGKIFFIKHFIKRIKKRI